MGPGAMFRSKRSWAGLFGAAVGILTALYVGRSEAAPVEFRDLRVEIVGQGRPVLMIPGLNSAASTWDLTCAALQPGVQCHIVQLPGSAGAPPVATDNFLAGMALSLLRRASRCATPKRCCSSMTARPSFEIGRAHV